MLGIADICTASAVAVLLLAALHDVALRTVPNTLVVLVLGIGLLRAVTEHDLLASCLVAGLTLLLGALLTWRGLLGGGDAKLLAACALVVAPWAVPHMLLATALAGGALCLPYLPGRRLLRRPPPGRPAGFCARVLRCERWRLWRRGPLPYAVAIASGTVFVLLQKV